jgi:hypothetical protein
MFGASHSTLFAGLIINTRDLQSLKLLRCNGAFDMNPTKFKEVSFRSLNFYQTTRRYNPEDSHLRTHRRENLKPHELRFAGLRCSLLCSTSLGQSFHIDTNVIYVPEAPTMLDPTQISLNNMHGFSWQVQQTLLSRYRRNNNECPISTVTKPLAGLVFKVQNRVAI